jgi:hypothetical protein
MAAIVGPMVTPRTGPPEGRLTMREVVIVLVTLLAVLGAAVALVLSTTSTVSALG